MKRMDFLAVKKDLESTVRISTSEFTVLFLEPFHKLTDPALFLTFWSYIILTRVGDEEVVFGRFFLIRGHLCF